MSETTLTPSTGSYKYYYIPDGTWGASKTIYIGSASEETPPGDRFGYFSLSGESLASLNGIIGSIASIVMSITTTSSSSGYNGCRACFDYVGTSHTFGNNHEDGAALSTKVWRFGGESGSVYLKEGATTQYTITDAATLSNFKTLIDNANTGSEYWFRAAMIANQSGDTGQAAGVILNGSSAARITFTITYNDSTTETFKCYIYTGSKWAPVTDCYVWNGGWQAATPYVYSSSKWN